jgi:hypothetical protein
VSGNLPYLDFHQEPLQYSRGQCYRMLGHERARCLVDTYLAMVVTFANEALSKAGIRIPRHAFCIFHSAAPEAFLEALTISDVIRQLGLVDMILRRPRIPGPGRLFISLLITSPSGCGCLSTSLNSTAVATNRICRGGRERRAVHSTRVGSGGHERRAVRSTAVATGIQCRGEWMAIQSACSKGS